MQSKHLPPSSLCSDPISELAKLLYSELEVYSRPMEIPEKPLDFSGFIEENVGYNNIRAEENTVLVFKMRLLRDWLEERITILSSDIKQKRLDPVVLRKFQNSQPLLQAALRRYWNIVVRNLNESVRAGLLRAKSTHCDYLRLRRDAGEIRGLLPYQTGYLENWYLEHIRNPYPGPEEKIRIACDLHLLPQQVTNWFQNKRTRSKKEMQSHKRSSLEHDFIAGLEETEATPLEAEDYAQTIRDPVNVDQNLWLIQQGFDEPNIIQDFIPPAEQYYIFSFW